MGLFCYTTTTMERKEPTRDLRKEHVELSFERGVQQSLEKIKEALTQQDEVVIAIYGSGVNVGKTHLLRNLSQGLHSKGFKVATMSTTQDIEERRPYFLNDSSKKGAVIFVENEGLPFRDVDIKIFIKRPNRPFHSADLAYADIVINNTDAKDK